jgi:leucyl/phenylalanyl-tRNA--protein transferase
MLWRNSRKDQDGTWITDEMLKAYTTYTDMERQKCRSLAWEELVGGLYGVDMGMFLWRKYVCKSKQC